MIPFRFLATAALVSTVWAQAQAQPVTLTPNSKHLSVSKYMYFNPPTGQVERYQAVGFYEPAVGSVKNKVLLMPRFSVRRVTFIDKSGTTIADPANASVANVGAIKVSLKYDGDMPNERQRLAVLGQIKEQPVEFAQPRVSLFKFNDMNLPSVLNQLFPPQQQNVAAQLKAIGDRFAEQEKLQAKWTSEVEAKVVAVQAVRMALQVSGQSMDERVIAPALISPSGVLPDLFLTDVSEYQLNRMKEGDFQVLLEYTFLDTNVGSINADFTFDHTMHQIVEESRKMRASSSKSGVTFLGFGKRKSKLTQSMREQSKEKIVQDGRAGTTIEMRDASPTLISMFESRFFPEVSKAQAVDAHMKAGQAAQSAGNEMLAKAHFGYADALNKDELDLKVDVDAALKSLAAKDYAGFVAKGVKMQKSEGSTATQYSRVLTRDVLEGAEINWTAVQSISTQRVVTQFIQSEVDERYASTGLCEAAPWVLPNPTGGTLQAMVPTCLVDGGPFQAAGIRLGELLSKVNGQTIQSLQDLREALKDVKPGTTIPVERLHWVQVNPMYGYWARTTLPVKTGRGGPIS